MACKCEVCCVDEERAERRARRFLYRHLTRAQRRSLKESDCFVVKGNVTGTKYQVYFDHDDSVYTLDTDGKYDFHYCLDVMDENGRMVPEGDRVLARKLLIEADEATFIKTAHRTSQR